MIGKFILLILINALALYGAGYFIPGFTVSFNLAELLTAALVLTLINLTIIPLLKFIFSPLVFITFGLAGIFINALAIYLLDYFYQAVIIDGLVPLIVATLIIGIINSLCQRLILPRP